MDTEQSATATQSAAPAENHGTTATSTEVVSIPDATLGNDQYYAEYSITAYPVDTLRSYSVGGRPAPAIKSRIPASSRPVLTAPSFSGNPHALIAIAALLGLVAIGLVVTTQARKHSTDRVNVAAASDQANLDSTQAQENSMSPADQKIARSAAHLSKLAGTVNQNQKLPRMVEDYMQELNAKGTEGVFNYRYRMTKVVANEFDSEQFLASQRLTAMKTQCGNPEDTGNLLKQGVVVRYSYLDKHNSEIASFDITSDDCP